ncbi:CbiX/SirB N-terminal domain-containing protein [Oscillospiraceae bacterium PP1C4]
MTGVLIVAHGSRIDKTEKTMETIRSYVQQELGVEHIIEAYMEFRSTNIEAGLLKLMEQGVDDIKVVPYFLFEGIHIREDIPTEIAAFQEKHPEVKIQFGNTLGADRRLAEVLADRVRELL